MCYGIYSISFQPWGYQAYGNLSVYKNYCGALWGQIPLWIYDSLKKDIANNQPD